MQKVYDLHYLISNEVRSSIGVPDNKLGKVLADLRDLGATEIGIFLDDQYKKDYITNLHRLSAKNLERSKQKEDRKRDRELRTFDYLSNIKDAIPDHLKSDFNNLVSYFDDSIKSLLDRLAAAEKVTDIVAVKDGYKFTYNRRTIYIIKCGSKYCYYDQASYTKGVPDTTSEHLTFDLIKSTYGTSDVI